MVSFSSVRGPVALALSLLCSAAIVHAQSGTMSSRVVPVPFLTGHVLSETAPNTVSTASTVVLDGGAATSRARLIFLYPNILSFQTLVELSLNDVLSAELLLHRAAASTGWAGSPNVRVDVASIDIFDGTNPTWNCLSDTDPGNSLLDCQTANWQGSSLYWLQNTSSGTLTDGNTGTTATIEATNAFKGAIAAQREFGLVLSKLPGVDSAIATFSNVNAADAATRPAVNVNLRMCCWDAPVCNHGFQGPNCDCDIPLSSNIGRCDTSTPDGPTLYPNFLQVSRMTVPTTLTHKVMFDGRIGDRTLFVDSNITVVVADYNAGNYGFLAATSVRFAFLTFQIDISAVHTVAQNFTLGAYNATFGQPVSGYVRYRGITCNLGLSARAFADPITFNGETFPFRLVLEFDPQECPSTTSTTIVPTTTPSSATSSTSSGPTGATSVGAPEVPGESSTSGSDNIWLWIVLGIVGAIILIVVGIGAALFIIKKKKGAD